MTLTRLGKCLDEPVSIKDELQLRMQFEGEKQNSVTAEYLQNDFERALVVYRSFSMRFTFIQVHKVLLHPSTFQTFQTYSIKVP